MVLKETKITKKVVEKYATLSDRTEGVGLFEDCSNSVVVFAKHMLGVSLYTWQRIIAVDMMAAIENEELDREFVVLTSRQVGKTTFASIFSLWVATFNKLPSSEENNSTAGIISASDIQAKLVLKEISKYIRLGDVYCRNHYSREKDDFMDQGCLSSLLDSEETNNMQTITFKRQKFTKDENGVEVPEYGDHLLKGSKIGTKLNSYPPTASVLGQTFAYLHEDEAGMTERFTDAAHTEYLHPTGDARNAIRLYTSTPWVTSGFFYELADPDDTKPVHNYKRYMFTIDAIKIENPKQYKVVVRKTEDMKLDGKKDEVDRAYYCKFVKGETSYFDPKDVDTMFESELLPLDKFEGECDIGVDFGGQVKSRTVITVTRLTKDKIIERLYHKVYDVGKDNNLLADIEEVMTRFPGWQRIIPDECFTGDTKVLMSDYTRKDIKDISIGDWVMSMNPETKELEAKEVTDTLNRGVTETQEVKFRNGTSVKCSSNHQWLTHAKNSGKIIHRKKTTDINIKRDVVPSVLQLPVIDAEDNYNYSDMYILGMYIAEGHKRKGLKDKFFISQLKEHTCNNIEYHLKNSSVVKWQRNQKGFYLSDSGHLTYLLNHVKDGSLNKNIPQECFLFGEEKLTGLWDGLIEGDGTVEKHYTDSRGYHISGRESYCTTSPELDLDMKTLGRLLGRPMYSRERVHSGFGSKRVVYEPVWNPNSHFCKPTFNESISKTSIVSITKVANEHMYDITVEGNHNFILADSGVITSNCPQGDYMIREMESKGWNVTPMNFRTWKVKKYGAFRSKLKKGEIKCYRDDMLKIEMKALEYSNTSVQSNIQAPRGYTDDCIDSFVMSCFYYIEETNKLKFFTWEGQFTGDD